MCRPVRRGSTRGCAATSMRWPTPIPVWRATSIRWACRGRSPTRRGNRLGRTDLNAAIDSEGRLTETRSDLGSAFGDWESIREKVHELAARAPERIDTDVLAALRSAERDPAGCSDDEYLALATADGPALDAVARAGGFAAPRHRRRRRDVRRQPQHQLHQHLLHRLPVLRVRAAQGRRRRVLAVDRRGRRPGLGGACRRRDRGVHAGRYRSRSCR